MLTKRLVSGLGVVAALSACAQANSAPTRGVIVHGGGVIVNSGTCPTQRPTSWPKSQFRVMSGHYDPQLVTESGALVFEVQIDSIPVPQGAQVSLWNQTTRQDSAFTNSPIRVTVPPGRYSFRVRRIGAQTLQDSVDVRNGYVDTVEVMLGREVVCLMSNASSR